MPPDDYGFWGASGCSMLPGCHNDPLFHASILSPSLGWDRPTECAVTSRGFGHADVDEDRCNSGVSCRRCLRPVRVQLDQPGLARFLGETAGLAEGRTRPP